MTDLTFLSDAKKLLNGKEVVKVNRLICVDGSYHVEVEYDKAKKEWKIISINGNI